jgi:putative peptidoglycan lipid II flippase
MSAGQAMPWLSFGVVIACLFQWLMTVPKIWPNLKIVLAATSIMTMIRQATPDLLRLGKPLCLGILGVAASQINNAIDSLFARFADPEGPALLWYAIRIQQLPLALFGVAIAGAILPPLSRALKAGRHSEYHHFLQDALLRTLLFMLPLTATLSVMGDSSVNFLYGRGDFGETSVIHTTYCLWAYGLGLLPSALVLILAPACYANSNYTLPALASFASMCLNLILNTLFINYLGWGALSVAVATSISAWVNLFILGWQLSSKDAPLLSWSLIRNGLTMGLATLVAVWGTFEMRIHFQQLPLFSPSLFSASFLQQLTLLACQALTFGIILAALFYILSSLFERNLLTKTLYEVDMNSPGL